MKSRLLVLSFLFLSLLSSLLVVGAVAEPKPNSVSVQDEANTSPGDATKNISKKDPSKAYGRVVAEIKRRGDIAVQAYGPANTVVTGNEFSRLYFEVFESSDMEFTLGLKDQSLMLEIESAFSQMISLAMRGGSKVELEATWRQLQQVLDLAVSRYGDDNTSSFWGLALQSFLILFREGVEAMLVVAALVAYLRRSGYADKVKVIWSGVAAALLASVATAWALNSLLSTSGTQREIMEGVTMLVAALLMVYVSFWLFARRDAQRWQAFVHQQMGGALTRGSMLSLAFVAFLAVYREGAETLLFYQALFGMAEASFNPIWIGMALAVLSLLLVYALVNLASMRLPLGLFFSVTAALLFVMAFIFVGKGMLELQVGGVISATALTGVPSVSWLGVFPSQETLLAQLLLLALLPIAWVFMRMKAHRSFVASR